MFDRFKQRQYPNLQLIQEMIHLGMEQMRKRPKMNEFRQASISSNLLAKATLILKSKQSYEMSLQNIADDFMVSLCIGKFLIEYFCLASTFRTFIRQSRSFD
jgi:hypothetical protein